LKFVDEPAEVEVRVDRDGAPVPRAFTWQGRWLTVTDLGRQWEEERDGGLVRHFLVVVAGGARFELTQHTGSGRWRVVRAWERSPLA
jgi:hypothetical protein